MRKVLGTERSQVQRSGGVFSRTQVLGQSGRVRRQQQGLEVQAARTRHFVLTSGLGALEQDVPVPVYFSRPKLRKLAVPVDDYQAAARKVSRDHFLLGFFYISKRILGSGS